MPDKPQLRLQAIAIAWSTVLLASSAALARYGPPAGVNKPAELDRATQPEQRNHPVGKAAEIALAEGYYGQKKCSLALPHYAKVGDGLREYPDAILHDAQCALENGGTRQVSVVLAMLSPDDGERHFAAGKMLVEHHAYAEAAVEFGVARKTYHEPYNAGYDQTLAYFKAGNFAAAIDTANELLNEGYRTAELADLAGNAYLKNHQSKQAYNAWRLATGIDPRNEDGYVDLCSLSLDRDDYGRGIEIANVGLSHLPQSMKLHLERGALRAMKGEFGEAQRDFDDAARLAPDDVSPQVSRGVLAMQMGRVDQSVEILRRAVTLAPHNYLSQYWYAEALLRAGATPQSKAGDDALEALEASVRANPGFWHSQTDLGKMLLERGSVDSAMRHLETAASLNPAATAPLYLLAQSYKRQGNEARAQALIARVSKMQAEDREAMARSELRRVVAEETTGEVR